jgi:hypothetical protein
MRQKSKPQGGKCKELFTTPLGKGIWWSQSFRFGTDWIQCGFFCMHFPLFTLTKSNNF